MSVSIHLYAEASQRLNTSILEINSEKIKNLHDLQLLLKTAYPQHKDFFDLCAWAIDNKIATNAQSIHPQSKIDLLPPVSGG